MFEYLILGTVQGITEWLPVSSEGVITLIKLHFFPSSTTLFDTVKVALFLHLGTALAAIVYFRKDIVHLSQEIFHYSTASKKDKQTITFLITTTAVSGFVGFMVLSVIPKTPLTESGGRILTAVVALLLFITAGLQLFQKKHLKEKTVEESTLGDMNILGIAQGFSILPGLSRSGLTVATFLLRNYTKKESLRLSFLMSIPVVLGANVILHMDDMQAIGPPEIIGLVASFTFGLLTIDLLLKLAQRINFGYFVLFFAILTFVAALV